MRLECEFSLTDNFIPVTTTLQSPAIPEIDLSADVYVPADLAALDYTIELSVMTKIGWTWIEDSGGRIQLKEGWNTYSFKVNKENANGNLDDVRAIGLMIRKAGKRGNS